MNKTKEADKLWRPELSWNYHEVVNKPNIVSEKTNIILSWDDCNIDGNVEFSILENRVIQELENPGSPNLEFLGSDLVLENWLTLLRKLLKLEKIKFYKLLETPDEEINFELFQEFSLLDYFFGIIYHIDSVRATKLSSEIIEEFQSESIEFDDEVAFSKRFYEMHLICRKQDNLNQDQIRILDLAIKSFQRNWVNLSEEKQNRLKEINQDIADLQFRFDKNILESETRFKYYFSSTESIAEIPEDILLQAKQEAQKDWVDWYKFTFSDTDFWYIMEYCSDPKVRKFFYNEYNKIWTKRNFDNRPIIIKLLRLRREQARILWFKNFAELSLDTKMANSTKEILMKEDIITKKAKKKAKKELEELKSYFWLDKINIWDLAYYSRLFKEQKYKIDNRVLRQYFEFENVLEKIFQFANELFWLEFKEVECKLYWDNVKVYEVYKSWKHIAYYIIDACYDKDKQNWAWNCELRSRSVIEWIKRLPIVANVASFSKVDWKLLLDYYQVGYIFHEFWHALHSMLSTSDYSSLSWENIEWDFTELPSQLMENWCEWEWLRRIAKHHKTWDDLSEGVYENLKKLKTFWSWISVALQNLKSKLDLIFHTTYKPKNSRELNEFVINFLNNNWIFKVWKRHRSYASYWHLFWWTWEYAAWFYSYLRAEIIEADIFEEFMKYWIFNKQVAQRYLETILSQWARKPAMELFKDFIWREPKIDAFLRKKWF